MATGEEALAQSLELLNYTDRFADNPNDVRHTAMKQRGLAAVNQIYSDLWFMERPGEVFAPLRALSEAICLSSRSQRDILPYGVAMLLAQSEGDGDSQLLYAQLYSQKRAGAMKQPHRRRDMLFKGGSRCGI